MLVLTRRLGQSVMVGEDVRLTVISVHGKNIRLAIEAPKNVRVLRGELTLPPHPSERRTTSHSACEAVRAA